MHPNGYKLLRSGMSSSHERAFGHGTAQELAAMVLHGKFSYAIQAVSNPSEFGVKCVIAGSFSWFMERNMPVIGLLGITVVDEEFYKRAPYGREIRIDMAARKVEIDGQGFEFGLRQIGTELHHYGGVGSAFEKFGKGLLERIARPPIVRTPSAANASSQMADMGF
jgi:3-isopropylmalate dehydratase small subunit